MVSFQLASYQSFFSLLPIGVRFRNLKTHATNMQYFLGSGWLNKYYSSHKQIAVQTVLVCVICIYHTTPYDVQQMKALLVISQLHCNHSFDYADNESLKIVFVYISTSLHIFLSARVAHEIFQDMLFPYSEVWQESCLN